MLLDIFGCHIWQGRDWPGMLLNILHCTGQPPHNKELSSLKCQECQSWETLIYTKAFSVLGFLKSVLRLEQQLFSSSLSLFFFSFSLSLPLPLSVWFWAEGTCAVNSKTRIAEVVILQRRQQEMWVQSLSQEDPLQEEMAKHSSIPAWEIPCMRSLAGYCPKSCKESDTTEWLNTSIGIGLLRFQKEQFLYQEN